MGDEDDGKDQGRGRCRGDDGDEGRRETGTTEKMTVTYRDDVEEVEVRKYESDRWRKMARAASPASMDFALRAKLMGVVSTEVDRSREAFVAGCGFA